MRGSKRKIVVNASVDRVFEYISDFTRLAEWYGEQHLSFVRTSKGPIRDGFTFERRGIFTDQSPFGEVSKEIVKRVIVREYSQNRRIILETRWVSQIRILSGGCEVSLLDFLVTRPV